MMQVRCRARWLVLVMALPGGVRAQVIGYDSTTGAPLDPAVIGAPPLPKVEENPTSSPADSPSSGRSKAPAHPPAKKGRRGRGGTRRTASPPVPPVPRMPKDARHLHALQPPPEHLPATEMDTMLRRSAGEANQRRQRIEVLETKVREVKSELETTRRGRHGARPRRH